MDIPIKYNTYCLEISAEKVIDYKKIKLPKYWTVVNLFMVLKYK